MTSHASAAQAEALSDQIKANLRSVAEQSGYVSPGDTTSRSPLDLFGVYLSISLGFVGITFTVQIVHGGYLWMTAGGNEEQVKKARSKISNGAIGAAITFFTYIISYFILSELGRASGIPGWL